MKLITTLFAISSLAFTASGAITLTISSNTVGNLTNLQNSEGLQGALVWGIVVDGNNNGFAGASALTPYDASFSYTSTTGGGTAGFALTVGSVATDDRLYISPNVMATSTNAFDSSANLRRPTAITNVTLQQIAAGATALVNPGDSFAIIWFDATTFNAASVIGQRYGMVSTATTGSTPTQALTLTSDGSTTVYASNFFGVEPVRLANLALGQPVPETSTSLLGALGALALLRRRRN